MAAADSREKPLQSAMKMANVAIQLEGRDRQQVGEGGSPGRWGSKLRLKPTGNDDVAERKQSWGGACVICCWPTGFYGDQSECW